MIASYRRPKLLQKSIRSILDTAKHPDRHEIIVRLSQDDPEAEIQKTQLSKLHQRLEVLIGPQLKGFDSLGEYFTDMATHCSGRWHHIWDDDMTIEGRDWDEQLEGINENAFVLCQHYVNGPNLYANGGCDGPGIGWFVPAYAWQKWEPAIGMPPDTMMRQLLVDRQGWPIRHLKNITLNHQWVSPSHRDK